MTRSLAGMFAAVTIACNEAPLPMGPTPPAAPYSIGGQVYDTIIRPVADVRIEVIDGGRAGISALTNADGRYELPGTFAGPISIQAAKDGYVTTIKRYDPATQEPPYVWFRVALTDSVDLNGT